MLGLNVNVSHWLMNLNAWSPAGGTVLEGCVIFISHGLWKQISGGGLYVL